MNELNLLFLQKHQRNIQSVMADSVQLVYKL
jgi:hypothetical protein